MNRKKIVAAGLVLTGFGLTAVVSPSSAVIPVVAAEKQAPVALAFNDHSIRQTNHSGGTVTAAGVDRRLYGAKTVIGYSVVRTTFDDDTGTGTIRAAVTLRRGILYLAFPYDENEDVVNGTVEGGTGIFDGATGTASLRFLDENDQRVRVSYTLAVS